MKQFILLILLTTGCGKNSSSSSSVPQGQETYDPQVTTIEAQYLSIINEHRSSLGLSQLTYSPVIEKEAREHSSAMAKKRRAFGHYGWKGRCRNIHRELNTKVCGEVVASGQKDPQEVFKAWLKSPSHRKALENPRFSRTGLGWEMSSSGRVYWTQMMAGD